MKAIAVFLLMFALPVLTQKPEHKPSEVIETERHFMLRAAADNRLLKDLNFHNYLFDW